MSNTNEVALLYAPEVTYGDIPAAGTWDTMVYTSEGLSATTNTTLSQNIRADRMDSDMPLVSATSGGAVNIEFAPSLYDDFLEAAMCSSWVADQPAVGDQQLKVGTTDSSFSFEKRFEDISKYITFAGQRVGQFSLSMTYGSILTGAITFAGSTVDTPAVAPSDGGTVNPATLVDVYNASSDVGTVKIDGVATDICIQALTIDINNNLRDRTCLGSLYPTDQNKGSVTVSGTVEMYLSAESFEFYKNVLTNTDVSLEYTVTDGTTAYTFLLPRVKLSGDSPVAGGKDQDVMLSLSYTGLVDGVENSSLVISKSPA